MIEETIYVAGVNGKVSHVYSDRPVRMRVVAWDSKDPQGTLRMSTESRPSVEKDRLLVEIAKLANKAAYSDDLLHGKGEQLVQTPGKAVPAQGPDRS